MFDYLVFLSNKSSFTCLFYSINTNFFVLSLFLLGNGHTYIRVCICLLLFQILIKYFYKKIKNNNKEDMIFSMIQPLRVY